MCSFFNLKVRRLPTIVRHRAVGEISKMCKVFCEFSKSLILPDSPMQDKYFLKMTILIAISIIPTSTGLIYNVGVDFLRVEIVVLNN